MTGDLQTNETGRAESKQSRGLMEARGSFFLHIHVKVVWCLLHLASGVHWRSFPFPWVFLFYTFRSCSVGWICRFPFPLSLSPDDAESWACRFWHCVLLFLFCLCLFLYTFFLGQPHGDGKEGRYLYTLSPSLLRLYCRGCNEILPPVSKLQILHMYHDTRCFCYFQSTPLQSMPKVCRIHRSSPESILPPMCATMYCRLMYAR